MEHTPFKISLKSLQLLPDFMVVYYDETNYPIDRYFFTSRNAAERFFHFSVDKFHCLSITELLSSKVRYIRLLSIHCIDDVFQYTSLHCRRLICY